MIDDRITRGEMNARFDGLEALVRQGFQAAESNFGTVNHRIDEHDKRIDSIEKDSVRLKTLWSVAVVAVAMWGNRLRQVLGL